MNKDKMVSVILFVEKSDDDEIYDAVQHIKKQTHKNIELIVSSFKENNSEEIKSKCMNSFLNFRWINHNANERFINEALEVINGEYVFYKTINGVEWYPRHIESHLEHYKNDKNAKWSLSHIENKDVQKIKLPYNTLGYRISNPPKLEEIIIDEICHVKNLDTDWSATITQDEDGKKDFFAGSIIQSWVTNNAKGFIPSEITVIQWGYSDKVKNQTSDKDYEKLAKSFGVPKLTSPKEEIKETDEGIEVKRKLPTLVGNKNHESYNAQVRALVEQTENIDSVGIKRTLGMGDVVVTEPIIRKVRDKYPNAKITYYTRTDNIIEYFESKPDEVVIIEEKEILEDYLSSTDNQLCIDLDLSYESRFETSFIDAYAEVSCVDFDNSQDKKPKLVYDKERLIDDNYIVLCVDGSMWPGKTWPISHYEDVVSHLHSKGYKVIETGKTHTSLTPKEYHNCDFDTLLNLIKYSDFYIGADNGPMHIARGFDIPCVIIAGAALPYYTSPNRDNIVYIQNNKSKNLGLKHRQFFNKVDTELGYTFVPMAQEDPECGLKQITPDIVNNFIDRFLDKPISPNGNEMEYAFNIYGNLRDSDYTEGYFYYKDNNTNIYWRENPSFHPEQSLDLSLLYEHEVENVWKNNLSPIYENIKDKYSDGMRVLDVGCNMGIFVNGCVDNNIDAYGIDINKKSIEKGVETYTNIGGRLTNADFMTHDFENKFDILVCNEIINNVDNPIDFIKKANKDLNEDGLLYVNFYNIGCQNWDLLNRKWEDVGIGEKITFFDSKTFIDVISDNGFELLEEYYSNKNVDMEFLLLKKVKDIDYTPEKKDITENTNDDGIIYSEGELEYVKNDSGYVERNKPFYHPDLKQKAKIPTYYNDEDFIMDSHQLIIADIQQNFSNDSKILDLGCGSGFLVKNLMKNSYNNIKGYDICRFSLYDTEISENIFIKDATSVLQEEDNDVVVLNDVISYVCDHNMLFDNVKKLLKTGGTLYFRSLYNNSFDYNCLKGGEVVRYFERSFLEKFIISNGFEIVTNDIDREKLFIKAIKND